MSLSHQGIIFTKFHFYGNVPFKLSAFINIFAYFTAFLLYLYDPTDLSVE